MARMGRDCNFKKKKNWASSFKFTALCLGKLTKIQIMVDSLFENSLAIFLLVFYVHFVDSKGTRTFLIWSCFDPKNIKISITKLFDNLHGLW